MGLGLRTNSAAVRGRRGPALVPPRELDEGALAAKARLSKDIERGKVVPQSIADTDPQRSGP